MLREIYIQAGSGEIVSNFVWQEIRRTQHPNPLLAQHITFSA